MITGACHCGVVKYTLQGMPLWVVACHCNACQRRTGSDYGISAVYLNDSVQSFEGNTKIFIREGDSGNSVNYEFCANCGTSLRWFLEKFPDRQIFAVGTIDDKQSFQLIGEMYTQDAAPWGPIGCSNQISGPPDDDFRQRMIQQCQVLWENS